MDSKKYLEQLSMIDLDINSKLKEIDDLTKLTKKLSGVTENMIVGADSSESILSPTMRKIVDLQTVYSQDMAELLGRKNCIIKGLYKKRTMQGEMVGLLNNGLLVTIGIKR